MSTRSGKPIHRTCHESSEINDADFSCMSDRKSRRRRQKINREEFVDSLRNTKYKKNLLDNKESDFDMMEHSGPKNFILKDLNIDSKLTQALVKKQEYNSDTEKSSKTLRRRLRNHKIPDVIDQQQNNEILIKDKDCTDSYNVTNENTLKNKKKRLRVKSEGNIKLNDIPVNGIVLRNGTKVESVSKEDNSTEVTSGNIGRRNKRKILNSKVEAKLEKDAVSEKELFKSPESTTKEGSIVKRQSLSDSFYSAAGSPESAITAETNELNVTFDKTEAQRNIKDVTLNTTYDKKSENSIELINISGTNCSNESQNCYPTRNSLKQSLVSDNPQPLLREGTFTKEDTEINDKVKIVREGTFTKEESVISSSPIKVTPIKNKISLPAPGSTPYHSNMKQRTNRSKSVLNITRSIEKPIEKGSSIIDVPTRTTRVTFCSPAANSVTDQRKSKMIKSSLKGSNKSFTFDETHSLQNLRPAARKRSYTQNDAECVGAKRKRLGLEEMQQSADRLSRPRTPSKHSKESTTPSKKPGMKSVRTKLPNFAALHSNQFKKMESLDEFQKRKSDRAKQLLNPSGTLQVLERKSPKEIVTAQANTIEDKKEEIKKLDPPLKYYTRFGFKLNTDINPFSYSSRSDKIDEKTTETFVDKKPVLFRQNTVQIPSLKGTTLAKERKDLAKRVVMREKSSTSLKEKRIAQINETRTIIKGVRTNKRFELQMKSRNINS